MNNARCKGVIFFFLLLGTSISYICARDNDQISDESQQPAHEFVAPENEQNQPAQPVTDDKVSPASHNQDNIQEPSQTPESPQKVQQEEIVTPVTEETVAPIADQSANDFMIPSLSEADEKAMQDALIKDLDSITTDKNVQELLNKTTNELLEKYNEAAIAQLQQLDSILEEIATNLTSNKLIPTRNRPVALQKILALRNDVNYLKNSNIVPLKAEVIYTITKQIQDLADYARINLEKGIDECEPYDIANNTLPALNNTEDVELQLQKALADNHIAIEKLRTKATRIGLHYYNIAWRWMHRNVFSPWQKYYMTPISFGALWLTAAGFFTWYYFGGKKIPGLPARFGTWLRNKVGWPAQTHDDLILNDANSTVAANQYIVEELENAVKKSSWYDSGLSKDKIENILNEASKKIQDGPYGNLKDALNKPVGWLGRFERRIKQFLNNEFMVGTMVLGPMALPLTNVAPNVLAWFSRTTQKIDNFLLGGVYRNKRIDEIIMNSSTRFKDVIGNESAKESFRTRIEYFKNPEAWERINAAPRTGILLYGPTRAGKSFLIDAFLGELIDTFGDGAGFKIWSISTSMILEKGIEWVLEQASLFAPCIVVIEEIDLLGLQRAENKQLLSSFLSAMNSCMQNNSLNKQVILLATTTNPNNIDFALLQIGRIGEHYEIRYPSHDERKLHIERELNKLAVMIEQFDIEHLACLTEGCAYEQITSVIKRALTAAKIDRIPVSQRSLEQSLERFVYGISPEPCKIDAKQKRRIATHLAGEIVATQLLDSNLQIAKATIKNVRAKIEEQLVYLQYLEPAKQKNPPLEYGKVFYCHDHDVLPLNSQEEQITECKIYRAGHMAETLILGSSSSYHVNDKQRAYEFALAAAGEGFDVSKLPSAAQNQFFDQAYKLVSQCEADVKTVLETHKNAVIAIADLLIAKETIGQEEVDSILKN